MIQQVISIVSALFAIAAVYTALGSELIYMLNRAFDSGVLFAMLALGGIVASGYAKRWSAEKQAEEKKKQQEEQELMAQLRKKDMEALVDLPAVKAYAVQSIVMAHSSKKVNPATQDDSYGNDAFPSVEESVSNMVQANSEELSAKAARKPRAPRKPRVSKTVEAVAPSAALELVPAPMTSIVEGYPNA